jgi:putative oxidoreductase
MDHATTSPRALTDAATRTPSRFDAALARVVSIARRAIAPMEAWITPAFDLALRLYVGAAFFQAGMVKIADWSTTLLLFENEYQVPLLPPPLAAFMGTAGELVLPVLLVLGLAGRFGAAGLFVMNLVAVISYPDLSDLGKQDHLLWGVMLLVTALHGPGRFSIDRWILNRHTSS